MACILVQDAQFEFVVLKRNLKLLAVIVQLNVTTEVILPLWYLTVRNILVPVSIHLRY